jgi:hypothetical protein
VRCGSELTVEHRQSQPEKTPYDADDAEPGTNDQTSSAPTALRMSVAHCGFPPQWSP